MLEACLPTAAETLRSWCLLREVLRTALAQGWGTIEYKSTAEVLADVRRVWDSYRQSYDPTDPVV